MLWKVEGLVTPGLDVPQQADLGDETHQSLLRSLNWFHEDSYSTLLLPTFPSDDHVTKLCIGLVGNAAVVVDEPRLVSHSRSIYGEPKLSIQGEVIV